MSTGASALPNADPGAPATLSDAAKVVAWGLVFWAGVLFGGGMFERNALAAAAVQAGVAEWGAGRMAIPWSDPAKPAPAWGAVLRRVGIGAALGALAALLVVAVAFASRTVAVSPGRPGLEGLGLALFVAGLVAVRDELLLRGVVVRATRLLPPAATLAACSLAAAAARLGIDGHPTSALLPEALRGAALGALWMIDRGAWMACGANAAWAWTLGAVLQGNLVDLRFANEAAVSAGVLAAGAALGAAVALKKSGRP